MKEKIDIKETNCLAHQMMVSRGTSGGSTKRSIRTKYTDINFMINIIIRQKVT